MTIAQAVFEKTRAVFPAEVGVFDAEVPGNGVIPPPRYVVLYLSADARKATTAYGDYRERRGWFQVRFVAPTRRECLRLADDYNDQILGWAPQVPGLVCGGVQPSGAGNEDADGGPASVTVQSAVAGRVVVETNLRYVLLADRPQ